ncbi:MAG: flagellar assembly protein FliW [Leifsonia sp.]
MIDTLTFTSPPPGLEPGTRFTLHALDGAAGVYAMRSVTVPRLRLFVVEAPLYVADYHPTLDADSRAMVAADEVEPVLLLVSSVGADGPTVNLAAPIAINPQTGTAVQVILDGQDWPLRHTLTVAA